MGDFGNSQDLCYYYYVIFDVMFCMLSGFSVKTLEDIKIQWDSFGCEFDAFSTWISEKEKELDSLKSSNEPLEQQISTAKVQ